ncbi:hypothetical protein [Parasedimentitalea psychrophila]|uniref:Uncharacterized protein n=1 Tax=Parasedimentitalea psychrophila TaxID=2997337 RepID=A0A9Y2P4V8_9RHOB|nr:hypothetical protein [Parasedimentitalea psychrophila]WIY27332.1 hypothetical protein QPJ95_10670 [Parasedimentitalea psychrophila]
MTLQDLPSATASWQVLRDSPHFLENLSRLFDEAFLNDLELIAGPHANRNDLRKGTIAATRAYLLERQHMEGRKPGQREFARMQSLKKKLGKLSRELERIHASPICRGKFADAIDQQRTANSGNPPSLSSVLDTRFGGGNPVAHIASFIDTLHQAAIAAAPQETDHLGNWQVADMADATREHELQQWAKQPKKRESSPLMALSRAFHPYWLRNSRHPFTAGKYSKKTKQNESYAVEAILLIAQKRDQSTTRANIVTVLGKVPP